MVKIDAKIDAKFGTAIDKYHKKVSVRMLWGGTAEAARFIYDEVKINASGARQGGPGHPPGRVTGNLAKSIYRALVPERSSEDTKTYIITWRHKDAPHGHLIEFGTSRSPAYPFVRPAASRIPDALKHGKQQMARRA